MSRVTLNTPNDVRAPTWAVGGAAFAAGGVVVGLLAVRAVLGVEVRLGEFGLHPIEAALLCGAVGAAWGVVVGALVAAIRARELAPVAIGAFGGAAVGLVGGGLTPLAEALLGNAPTEVSFALAWGVAGLLAGVVGSACSGRDDTWADDRGEAMSSVVMSADETSVPVRRGSAAAAIGWAVGTAAVAAAAMSGGLMFARYALGVTVRLVELADHLTEAVGVLAAIGVSGGVVVGGVAGLAVGRGRLGPTAAWAVGGAVTGLIGGGLTPVAAAVAGGPTEASFAAAWAVAGAFAGLVGYGGSRPAGEPVVPPDDPSPSGGPVVAVSVLAVVAALAVVCFVGRAGDSGSLVGVLALLAVGAQGVAVVAVVRGQERRLRVLEKRLRRWEDED